MLSTWLPRLSLADTMMLKRQIPTTGEQIPIIGLGTADVFNVDSTPEALKPLAQVLDRLFGAGGTVIDTAPSYVKSQGVVGTLLAQQGRADQAFLATKVEGQETSIADIEAEMKDLQGAKIDLLQVHSMINFNTVMPFLREMKQQGQVRYIGITHHSERAQDEMIKLVEKEPMDFVQINLNTRDTAAEKRLLPLCQDKGVAVMINRPFLDGQLFRVVEGKPVPEFAAEIGCTSWAELMIKYIISHPSVTCVIPATSKPEHMAENAAAGSGVLPDEPMRRRIAAYFE
ncbi:diketogulonate reductase-like aldo/keto reductase [Pseudomonas duriflava]|uniref:Diketogulonate reductase-like aldo/keto reductase n=1 Tax=Pseudomonas duriflava TaxID=459528 RepID=A0A562QFM3_9PSED|nr:aldo/keto reductase [Pseudomonas duriflava]TWI55544.1 diketogulonate reductase-like aldo/keto reductase [Pseudomonas duriflava]